MCVSQLLICLSILTGCGKDNATGDMAKPFQEISLQVAVPQGWQFRNSWDVDLEEWSARTGAKVDLVESDFGSLSKPLIAGNEPPQLIFFPWTRKGELLADKLLQPFPRSMLEESQLNWNDLFQGLREKQGTMEGGPFLFPLSSPVLVCYFRADLLEKAGLAPPESWADYQVLLNTLENWAPGLTAAEPWSPEFRATLFLARSVSFVKSPGQLSVFFDVDSGNPFISSPGFVKGLEVSQAAVKRLPRDVLSYDPVTCRNLVVTGKAALAIGLENGPAHLPLMLGATSPIPDLKRVDIQRADKISIGIVDLPGASQVYNSTFESWETYESAASHIPFTGFAGLCAGIPSSTSAKEADAALNLLSALIHEADSSFPSGSRSPVREADMTNRGAWVGQELSAEEAGDYVATVARCLRDRQQVSELPVIGHAEFRAALTRGISQAIEANRPATEALSSVSDEWNQILTKLGQERVLTSYRRALGLSERQVRQAHPAGD